MCRINHIYRLISALLFLVLLSCQPAPTSTPPASPTHTFAVTLSSRLIGPNLTEVEPATAAPGESVRVTGTGGYYMTDGGYDESARYFDLTFDGQPIGRILCYINFCAVDITVPEDASPGSHTIALENGSDVFLEVLEPDMQ